MALVATLYSPVSQAVVYKYVGPGDVIHYTNTPIKSAGYTLVWRSAAFEAKRSKINISGFERNRNKFGELVEETAKNLQLQPALLHAVVRVESLYDPEAKSRAGAVGLMQLMPETAQRYGVANRRNPSQNLYGGARYLKDLLELYQYDLRLALAAYNAGEEAVKRYGYQVPPFPETQQYVEKVLNFYQEYRQGGSS